MNIPALKGIVRKAVAWLPMHSVFWIGHGASRIINNWPDCKDDSLMDRLGTVIYRVYNRCMCWSLDLNDWAGFTLWKK